MHSSLFMGLKGLMVLQNADSTLCVQILYVILIHSVYSIHDMIIFSEYYVFDR